MSYSVNAQVNALCESLADQISQIIAAVLKFKNLNAHVPPNFGQAGVVLAQGADTVVAVRWRDGTVRRDERGK